ncbi:MAG: saccharopine dehydrogenase family protein [Bacteroidales bacterium]|nr:saccharopine dehydrogenase family protein [Bacteroidales bacterium]
MSKVLVIGCGGVASVAIAKICQNDKVFSEMCIASRTVSKCEAMKEKWQPKTSTKISTVQIDANSKEQVVALIKDFRPDVLLHVGMPYHNIVLMQACAENNVHYIDTAAYEPEDTNEPVWRKGYEKRCKEKGFVAYFDYAEQWSYFEKFKNAGVTALLGGGFDPGVTNVFVAYAKKHFFDTIEYVDILDCNGGDHGYPFATNFNTEINLREVSSPADYYENGKWVGVPAMSIKREYDFPEIGKKDMYLLHHEEIESLTKNFPEIKRMRFYMTFGKSYLTHMKCLENVGLLNSTPVKFGDHKIIPIQFLKSLMPDPSTLGERTVGKTNIGCIFTGYKDGKKKHIYIYNVCDHQESFKEVGSQAISYTTGVPAMISAALLATGQWKKAGVYNLEEFDPDPFMEMLNEYGLPWKVEENPVLVE